MSYRIYRYPLAVSDEPQQVVLPLGAVVVAAGRSADTVERSSLALGDGHPPELDLWAAVPVADAPGARGDEVPLDARTFCVVGTDAPWPEHIDGWAWIAMYASPLDPLVWHVLERGAPRYQPRTTPAYG